MKTKSILFNTEMVQAILDGRKTQTRRTQGLKKINQYLNGDPHNHSFTDWKEGKQYLRVANEWFPIIPKYQPGDILWVRETFAPSNHPIHKWMYKAGFFNTGLKMKWKPSIHMPKAAARIFLQVTNVRVERLQDITETDAILEGVKKHSDYGNTGYIHYGEPDAAYTDIDAVWSFETLWQSINGEGSWDENPWVWVYEFERIQKLGNF